MRTGGQPLQASYAEALGDGRVQCRLCPHRCVLRDGQRGKCFVRFNQGGVLLSAANGRVSGLAVDPIEKKPLYHFLPGSRSLSFGVIGCNLSCQFCQNWNISHPRDDSALAGSVTPEAVAELAVQKGCASASFTYNEPIVSFEFTREVARACRARGLRTVAVTAGYIEPEPRREFFGWMDAANVDLKSFRDDFYRRLCGARLQPVLDTLSYLRRETPCWLEVTTLLIPGENDEPSELEALARWCFEHLGPDTPMHFSAFYPQHRMRDRPPTPPALLRQACAIARECGMRHVYTGNIVDPEGSATRCSSCGARLLARDGFALSEQRLDAQGRCPDCGMVCAGVFG